MASHPIVSWFVGLKRALVGERRPDLHSLSRDCSRLPGFVHECPVALRYLDLLGPLAWDRFPERNLGWQPAPVPYAPFAAACLVKIDQHMVSMGQLRQYLVEHPALTWLLGFPLKWLGRQPRQADVAASLPSARHFTRLLRTIPNEKFQFLLGSSVQCILAELHGIGEEVGQTISMDTKHIIACVKENNPKTFVADRYDKTKQPAGDPDCKLGCKRRHNRRKSPENDDNVSGDAKKKTEGEFYWGYSSGIVAAQVPGWGEFILAELTLPFDQPDVAHFFPLMALAEQRLGFRPHYGAFDAAYDAHYVYDFFHSDAHDGFAAVAPSNRGAKRSFDVNGLPLCPAGLAMPLKETFFFRQTRFPHPRGRYACPLCFPEKIAATCPLNDAHWEKGGCLVTMPTSIGARLRHQLDRDSERYKQVYRQRTATERLNARSTQLGIERPNLRNGQAISNLNTLIYALLNLHTLLRILLRKTHTPRKRRI